jgi:DNA-binding NarL/FixJ family response regulator
VIVVGEAADGPAAVRLANELDPDVAVVDVSMPGLGGAEATAQMREARPDRKVVALTVHEDPGYLRLMLDAGATGYVLKRSAAAELVRAVRAVAAGGAYTDPALAAGGPGRAGAELRAGGDAGLSEREEEVVRLIALGYGNKQVAARLKVSAKTVETYKARSLEKLGIRSRVEVVRFAVRQGWLASH